MGLDDQPRPDPGDDDFHLPTLAVIGVGLIGGSAALALKRAGRVGAVVGAGRTRASLERARELGVIDDIADANAAAARADLILIATPVNAVADVFATIAPALAENESAVVTDVGSVKVGVCAAAQHALGASLARFVPGHPVAGKEHSGVDAASADLFDRCNVALTPLPTTDADALAQVRRMWCAIGARVITMEVAAHDRALALTSHLPHVLAYAMVDLFIGNGDGDGNDDRRRELVAGGFYDFTRTASSDAEMWRDICLMNRAEILRCIDRFDARLSHLRALIERADGAALEALFNAAKDARAGVGERR